MEALGTRRPSPSGRWRGVITWRIVRGGVRSVLEGFFGEFLKRRIKDFDHYFPTKKKGLGGLRR